MNFQSKISLLLSACCSAICLSSQNAMSLKQFPQGDRDSIFTELRKIFPSNWSVDSIGSVFFVTRADTLLYKSSGFRCGTYWTKTSEPPPDPIFKIKFQLKLEVQPFWTDRMIKQSQEKNKNLRKEIAQLPAKHKIKIFPRMKDEGYEIDKKDSLKAAAFLKEEGELKAEFERKPSFSSKNYSFFLLENLPNSGFGSYPMEASVPEEFRIRVLEGKIKTVLKEFQCPDKDN